MRLKITKSARKFGYIIWSKRKDDDIKKLINNNEKIFVRLNGFMLGEKKVDWKYHRISLGYNFTRGLPEEANYYDMKYTNNILEVIAHHV